MTMPNNRSTAMLARIMLVLLAAAMSTASGCSLLHRHKPPVRPTPSASAASASAAVAASSPPAVQVDHYTFVLDNFTINDTRSHDEDTDTLAFAVSVDGQLQPVQIVHWGDVDNGTYPANLIFYDVPIPSDAHKIVMSYQIVNAGHSDDDEIMKASAKSLVDMAVPLGGAAGPEGAAAAYFAGLLADAGIDYLFANCDGPVAIDAIAFSPTDLASATDSQGKHFSESRAYQTTDGCNTSNYSVEWSVRRANIISLLYDLGGEFAGAWYDAAYGYPQYMDDELRQAQEIVDYLTRQGVFKATPGDLFGLVHAATGGGSTYQEAFNQLRATIDHALPIVLIYPGAFDMGWLIGDALGQPESPLPYVQAALQVAHDDLVQLQDKSALFWYFDVKVDPNAVTDNISQVEACQDSNLMFPDTSGLSGPTCGSALYLDLLTTYFAIGDGFRQMTVPSA